MPKTSSEMSRSRNRKPHLLTIEDFNYEIRFLELVLLISTLLIIIINNTKGSLYVDAGDTFFIFLIISSVAYYFAIDFRLFRNRLLFYIITAAIGVVFAGTIFVAIAQNAIFSWNTTLAEFVSFIYVLAIVVLTFSVLVKPVHELKLKL